MVEISSTSTSMSREIIDQHLIEIRQNSSKQVVNNNELIIELLNKSFEYIEDLELTFLTYQDFLNILQLMEYTKSITHHDVLIIQNIVLIFKTKVSIKAYQEFIQGHIDLTQSYGDLLTYSFNGFITAEELETYIYHIIPNIKALSTLQESFHPYYTYAAIRRFLFYLDLKQVNKIPISKVINCEVFEEFLSLNRVLQAEKELGANEVLKRLSLNWFNASNILNLYQTYSRLDADHNGTLNKNEFLSYTGNAYDNPALHFTPTAVTRIFEMLLRYSDCNEELDFKAFVDFTLIMSNKESTRSKQFFWNVLNINSIEEGGNGKLSIDVIEYFYRDICHGLIDSGCDAPQFHNIVIEIHDILGCSSSDGITLQDVMTSSQGHTVMLMLLDINTFWAYDNRESLIPSDDDAG